MTLDLARIVHQLDDLVGTMDPDYEAERIGALRVAWRDLNSDDVRERFTTARTSFLLARSESSHREFHGLPSPPENYRIVGTDGSMILPNRHSPARFYMINIGTVRIAYGSAPEAVMETYPDIRFSEDDLFVESGGRRLPVTDAIVGLRRAVQELAAAAAATDGQPLPCMALIDGSLILWTLMGQDETTTEEILSEYLEVLWWFKQRGIPVASYISSPGATDLMNTLRVSICDYPPRGMSINCDDCRARLVQDARIPACDILPNVTDGYLMHQIASLQPGHRTNVFDSDSKILDRYGADLRSRFCYINVGTEIARIEIPAWVSQDHNAMELVHAVIYDQCQLGRGYPVVLQEAHEMAVINMSDRALVDELIERRMAAAGMTLTRSGKDGSKRARFV